MAGEKKRKAVYDPEAQRRWREKNKERDRYLRTRTHARTFIRKKALLEDLEELKHLIALREACFPLELDNNNEPVQE